MNDLRYRLSIQDSYKIAYYQQEILQKTAVSPLVRTQIGADDDGITIISDTGGLLSFKEYCAANGLSRQTAIKFILHFLKTAAWCSEHLLDPVCLTVTPGAYYSFAGISTAAIDTIVFVYIPVRDPAVDVRSAGVCETMMEQMTGTPVSSLFTRKEMDLIAMIDLYNAESGIHTMMAIPDEIVEQDQDTRKTRSGILAAIRSIRFNPGIRFMLASVLAAQFTLILFAFTVLRNAARFSDPRIPVVSVCVILLVIAAADAVLFLHRSSPLKQIASSGKADKKKEDKELFAVKEEKTTLLTADGQNTRIAMICSGMPGTAEESSGKKAYVLVDDFLIGRDKSRVDFRIDSLSVGRVHARIIRRHNAFFIEDLDSKNGTFIDKKKLKKNSEYLLPEKCRIRFAGQEYYFIAS